MENVPVNKEDWIGRRRSLAVFLALRRAVNSSRHYVSRAGQELNGRGVGRKPGIGRVEEALALMTEQGEEWGVAKDVAAFPGDTQWIQRPRNSWMGASLDPDVDSDLELSRASMHPMQGSSISSEGSGRSNQNKQQALRSFLARELNAASRNQSGPINRQGRFLRRTKSFGAEDFRPPSFMANYRTGSMIEYVPTPRKKFPADESDGDNEGETNQIEGNESQLRRVSATFTQKIRQSMEFRAQVASKHSTEPSKTILEKDIELTQREKFNDTRQVTFLEDMSTPVYRIEPDPSVDDVVVPRRPRHGYESHRSKSDQPTSYPRASFVAARFRSEMVSRRESTTEPPPEAHRPIQDRFARLRRRARMFSRRIRSGQDPQERSESEIMSRMESTEMMSKNHIVLPKMDRFTQPEKKHLNTVRMPKYYVEKGVLPPTLFREFTEG